MGGKPRFPYIDQFRGLVIVLMLLDHSSYYLNSMWKHFDPLDPLFGSWAQFALRYSSYLCAPGFLMLSGAMVWYSYTRRLASGQTDWQVKGHLLLRGLFLVLLQVTWVNSSWGGFREFKPGHIGIIACIGISIIFLTPMVNTRWFFRLAAALVLLAVHPLLLRIPYDAAKTWPTVLMQTFVDAGDFNKYPVLPWFALALLGSVMAHGWLQAWKTRRRWLIMSFGIAAVAMVLATAIRLARGYGNLSPFSELSHWSFLMDLKYPPSLYFNLWFFGAVVAGVAIFRIVGDVAPKVLAPLGVVGRVSLFFYCMHIAILGVFSKRIGIYYLQGGVGAALIGAVIVLAVMFPLSIWFGGVKRRSKNFIIQMI